MLSSCGFILDQSGKKGLPSQSVNLETLWDSNKTLYIAGTNLLLSWQAASGSAVSYKVEVFESAACSGTPAATKTQDATDYLLSSLVDGQVYSIRLTAFNTATTSSSVCSSTIGVDMQNPTVSLSVVPPAIDLAVSGSITFSGVDVGMSGIEKLECKLDSAAYEVCSSPKAFSSIAFGSHTFSIKATDKAGNVSSDSYTWMVTQISTFQITGIRATTVDTTADIWLTTNQAPRIDWTDATNEAEYEVGIYANNGSTIACALATVPANTTSHTFSGCSLTNLTNYKIQVVAKSGSQQRTASNAPFVSGVNFGAILDASLVAAYGFEENAGTVAEDASGNNNTGVLNGASWTAAGKYGNALSFSGAYPSHVNVADSNSLDVTSQMTMMAWYKPTGVINDWRTLLMKENSARNFFVYTLFPRDGGGPTAFAGAWISGAQRNLLGGAIPAANTWQHLTMTYDGANMRIYYNGTLGNSVAQTGAIEASTGPLFIGGNSVWTSENFDGLIDEVRIYNRALTGVEISNAMGEAISLVPAFSSGPGGFKISGVSGGQDLLSDLTFLDTSASPTLSWTAALGAASYRATLFEDDGTTVKCVEQNSADLTVAFTGCLLSPATYYRASVAAVGSDNTTTLASNSNLRIYTGLLVLPVYPISGPQWMDSVYNNGATVYQATDSPCSGSESRYSSCLHGGEMKKVATRFSSCSGLSMSDQLGAFRWTCFVESGNAIFYSAGFQSGKGLKDLINPTSWKTNLVSLSGAATGSSIASAWWTNPIVAAPTNANPTDVMVTLDQPTYAAGTILTIAATTATGGYDISGTKLALVTLGSSVLHYNGNAVANCNGGDRCILVGSGPFVWVEGIFDGTRTGGTVDAEFILYGGWTFARVHNSIIRNGTNMGMYLAWSGYGTSFTSLSITKNGFNGGIGAYTRGGSLFEDIDLSHNVSSGLYMSNTSFGNDFRRIRASNNGTGGWGVGLVLAGTSHDNRFFDIVTNHNSRGIQVYAGSYNNSFVRVNSSDNFNGTGIAVYDSATHDNTFVQVISQNNSGEGIAVVSAKNNIFSQLTLANNADSGISLAGAAQENTFQHLVSANNPEGIWFDNSTSVSNNTFGQLAVIHSSTSGIHLGTTSASNKFAGQLILGDNLVNCNVPGGTNPGLVDVTCTSGGTDGSATYPGGFSSSAQLRLNKTLATSFVGKVTLDDSSNASDTTGSASFPADTTLFDWDHFENLFRAWGRDGAAFPNANHRSVWAAGTGRIWDWRLKQTDAVLLGKSGDGAALNAAFVPGSACPAAVAGALGISNREAAPKTYLLNATEIIDPLDTGYSVVGNHNGLCESNESCLYLPNFGAYQGHGTLGTCVFTGGVVSGVTIYGHASNGL